MQTSQIPMIRSVLTIACHTPTSFLSKLESDQPQRKEGHCMHIPKMSQRKWPCVLGTIALLALILPISPASGLPRHSPGISSDLQALRRYLWSPVAESGAHRKQIIYDLPNHLVSSFHQPHDTDTADGDDISVGTLKPLLQFHSRDIIELQRMRRNSGPSLSIVNPLDVLRQRLLLEIARRKMRQSQQSQIIANNELLQKIGRR